MPGVQSASRLKSGVSNRLLAILFPDV